jgi:hypothetical protein
MYARNDFKRLFYPNPNARFALAVARRRLAAWVDGRVARWLERCASNVEAAQRLFPDPNPVNEFRTGREPSRLAPTMG